jgi:hypothetical protein
MGCHRLRLTYIHNTLPHRQVRSDCVHGNTFGVYHVCFHLKSRWFCSTRLGIGLQTTSAYRARLSNTESRECQSSVRTNMFVRQTFIVRSLCSFRHHTLLTECCLCLCNSSVWRARNLEFRLIFYASFLLI